MPEKYEKFLPIGSVVILKGATKKLMITGFCMIGKDQQGQKNIKVFDYVGCLYPDGVVDSSKNILFDHEAIEKIFAIGYSDDEEKKFKEMLKQELEKRSK